MNMHTFKLLNLLAGIAFAGAVVATPLLAEAPQSQSSGNIPLSRQAELSAPGIGDFARSNLATFRTFTLKNGIPVIVKLNPSNRILNIRMVLRGGSALTTPEQAGIEGIMLRTMARGSATWSYEKLTQELEATSSTLWGETAFDAGAYCLNTLDKYFDRVFPVWADTIVAPAFAEKDFALEKTTSLQALEALNQDPWRKLARDMNKRFFANHPYQSPTDGTKESMSALTRDTLKNWYDSHVSANRMVVVAVGNFDIEKLRTRLDATLGTIADKKVAIPVVSPLGSNADASNPGDLSKVLFPSSKGIAYIRGDFPAPVPSDRLWMAANITFKMYSNLLFEIVRSKYSSAYSPGAYTRGFAANYGTVSIYKTSNPADIKGYIDEALKPLTEGKCLATKGGSGTHGGASEEATPASLETIEEALPVYKAQYINEVYEQQQTNNSIAAQIASSIILYGDYRYWLLDMDRLQAVTPADIRQVVATVLTGQRITWGVLGDQAILDTIDAAPYAAR